MRRSSYRKAEEHLKEIEKALALNDRFVLMQILIRDKPVHWTKKILTKELRIHALIETKHIVCEIMRVKRLPVGGAHGVYSYAAGLCRCDSCNVNLSIPDDVCPCCNRLLRRSNHWKTGSGAAIVKRIAHEID